MNGLLISNWHSISVKRTDRQAWSDYKERIELYCLNPCHQSMLINCNFSSQTLNTKVRGNWETTVYNLTGNAIYSTCFLAKIRRIYMLTDKNWPLRRPMCYLFHRIWAKYNISWMFSCLFHKIMSSTSILAYRLSLWINILPTTSPPRPRSKVFGIFCVTLWKSVPSW